MHDIKIVKFSIICATYNRSNFIADAILSVINQSYIDWEMIIVDDGSQDTTEFVVDKFICDRVKYIKLNKNSGVGRARNIGISQSTGDWIIILDSDNRLYSGALSAISSRILAYPNIDFHNFTVIDVSGNILSEKTEKSIIINFKEWVKSPPSGEFHSVVRRKYLIKNPFLEKINGGEHITWNYIVHETGFAAYHPNISEVYDNVSLDRLSIRKKNIKRIYDIHLEDFKSCGIFYIKYAKKRLFILIIKIIIYKLYNILCV